MIGPGAPPCCRLECLKLSQSSQVNDEDVDLKMKLGKSGEAYFVSEADTKDVELGLETSPIMSPVRIILLLLRRTDACRMLECCHYQSAYSNRHIECRDRDDSSLASRHLLKRMTLGGTIPRTW